MLIVLLLAPVIITAACIQSPGFNVLSEEALPLTFGFMNNFSLSSSMSALLFVPALFQSYHAYVYVFGRLLRSMADSRLLPSILQSYHSKHHTPYVGIVAGSLAVFCLMFLRLFASHSYDILCGISSIGTIFIYLLIACSFCIFRQRYQTLERQVVNPFGVAGSIYAILIILLALISVCAFIPYGYLLISFFFVLVFFVTLFYFFYARHKQRFSEDEQKIFFLAYVINGEYQLDLFFHLYFCINNVCIYLANRGKTKAMNKRSKSMYMTADHNSTASTSIRSYRRISDSSAGGRVDLSHRSKPPGLNSPETSVDRRMSRISSPKPSSVNSSENHAGRCSSPGSLSPAKMLQDGDQRQLSQDNISVDTRYTMVENLFTITEENNGIKLDAGSLDDADTQAIIDRDMVLESFPSSTILMEDFKSPRNLLATGKKLSEKKLTINAPLSAEDPMTSTVADIPTTKKPMSIETKRKMMILKMAAFGGFKDRSEVVKNKNRITLPPIESTKHRTSDPLPKVFEDEHITEFPSMEHVIARRKSFTEQQQQLQLQNSESMDEEDPKAKVVDESYMHHLDSQHKSASMFRRGFGGTIMSSIKVLSSMKVVPFVNDPLFNEYTEEFVNSRLGETEKIQQQQQRRYLEQLRREYSFAPVEEVASPRSQTKQEEDFESNKHPTNTGDADPVLTYDFPQELSEEHIPSTSAEQQHDLESNGRH